MSCGVCRRLGLVPALLLKESKELPLSPMTADYSETNGLRFVEHASKKCSLDSLPEIAR